VTPKGNPEVVNRMDNTRTMIYNTLHRKAKVEQHEPHKHSKVKSGAPEGYAVPVPVVSSAYIL